MLTSAAIEALKEEIETLKADSKLKAKQIALLQEQIRQLEGRK